MVRFDTDRSRYMPLDLIRKSIVRPNIYPVSSFDVVR